MDMQREDKSKLEIHVIFFIIKLELNFFQYANERLASALKYYEMNYPFFKNIIDKSHILINKRVLAQLALCEPKSFQVFI